MPQLDLIRMPRNYIQGTLNMLIDKVPNPTSRTIARACYSNYITFLFSQAKSVIKDPIKYEEIREKKNDILANLELSTKKRDEERLDLEKFNVRNPVIQKAMTEIEHPYPLILFSLYDGSLRINEFLSNDWTNINEENIFIHHTLSKTHRDRTVGWLCPLTGKYLLKWQKEVGGQDGQTVTETTGITEWQCWWRFKKFGFTPHYLRHTRLTHLAPTWEIGNLQRRAGHSSTQMTQRYIAWVKMKGEKIIPFEEYCKEKGIDLEELLRR